MCQFCLFENDPTDMYNMAVNPTDMEKATAGRVVANPTDMKETTAARINENPTIIGDILVDQNAVKEGRHRHMVESFESYKKANILLGYFSQLKDYAVEYDQLTVKVFDHRREVLKRYADILTEEYNFIFKQLLVPPTKTEWYRQGINKYKKVKDYSMYYYRRQLYISLEEDTINLIHMKDLIRTIVILDKYYDIYDETINFFMSTSSKFEDIMKKHFTDYIHL